MLGGDVGSIGIFAMHEDLTGVADKAGAKVTLIKAGKHKTEGHPFEPLNAESRAAIQARVDDAYARFVAAVAAGRRVSEAAVRRDFGQGRLVGAREALAAGMVDSIETLDQVIDRLRRSPTRSPVSAARHAAGTPPAPRASGVTGQDRAAATCFWQNARLDLLECNVTHAPHDTVQERHR